jgi:homoserine O-succinyltransferase/O-acetyltransferase
MPVLIESWPNDDRQPRAQTGASAPSLRIGLINNMSDEALKATERQYASLLNAASGDTLIRLSLYTLPGIRRSPLLGQHINNIYSDIEDLWDGQLDGLIVTGREPLTANLKDEPYWTSFTKVLEWAKENVFSTIWSCLAAHAAILHMDGIQRVKHKEKLFGIFECVRASDHWLTQGAAPRTQLPHSRWNGVVEADLTECGYGILTRTADAGVDTFIKQQRRLFVFFQGHPEYESDTLLREYRRDIGRYFRHELSVYPLLPRNYFDDHTGSAFHALGVRAAYDKSEALKLEIWSALDKTAVRNTWHCNAASIYKIWLEYLRSQKNLQSEPIAVLANLEHTSRETGAPAKTVFSCPATTKKTRKALPPWLQMDLGVNPEPASEHNAADNSADFVKLRKPF